MTRSRSIAVALACALAAAVPIAPAAAAPNQKSSGLSVPVAGTDNLGGTFAGTLRIREFVRTGDAIAAVGTLTGTITSTAGEARTVVTPAAIPLDLAASGGSASAPAAALAQTACDVLHLELGPLDLDLLGLVVHLDRIVLDIAAQPGAGNLLGNLLCQVVGLLDPLGSLAEIVSLLNQIVDLLG